MAGEKLRAHRQFVGREAQRFARDRFRYAIQLKQNVAGPHRRDPIFGLAFTFTHARFRWTRGTDLSGKIRIQNLPLRFMLRVSATRAASICVLVIQARSSVCKPNSPKSIRRLREAVPLRLPRWAFRYFTRFGINGIESPPKLQLARAAAVAARQAQGAVRLAALLFYKSSISRRSCRKPCWLRQSRNQSACAACAAELFPRDTIPNAKSPRRSVDRSCGT